MHGPRAPIVGRETERETVERFTLGMADGPAALVLDGLAGIGKTAIWTEGVTAAQLSGIAVRSCRCTESDAGWAFAGLGDLLDGLSGDVTNDLPEIQQRALAGALLISDVPAGQSGDRVVAVAVLGVLRALSRSEPLLLAIDDIQWLDPSSRKVLSFALRRLRDEPVRLLASCRTSAQPGVAADSDLGLPGERLLVGAASIGTLQRIVQARLDHYLSRPTLTRLHRATGGNPMMFLEMARALQRRGGEPGADEPLPVPSDLRSLVTESLHGLSPPTRQLLLVTAALAQPTLSGVASAIGDAAEYRRSLAEAVEAGVLEVEGQRLRFAHPLIASIPYEDLTAPARRRLHERLAQAVTDPEQHARHAALAAAEPSESVAAALDIAARHARGRGSLDSAAELAELAVTMTPAGARPDLLRRSVALAEYLFLLGDPARARTVVNAGLRAAAPGPARVPGLLLQATIASWEHGDATVAQWCTQALAEAGDDPLLRARCHATFAETSPSGAEADLEHAHRAVDLLHSIDSPPSDLLSNALTNLALHGCRLGRGLAVTTLERAVALQAQGMPPPVSDRAGLALGMCLRVVDRFEDSRTWLQAIRTAATDEGDDSALPNTLGQLAILECWAGEYQLALRYAMEGREHAVRLGCRAPMLDSAHVLVLAHLGRLGEARDLAVADLASDEALGFETAVALHLRSLGFTELAAGNPAAAAAHFLRAVTISRDTGIREPAIMRLHPDAVTALLAVGNLDEADRLTAELDASTERNRLPWSTVMADRCHGLLRTFAGDTPGAAAALERALAGHERLPMPFEEARTRLLYGMVLRRAGRRGDAKRELEAARTVFLRLGTPVQAEQARTELASIGGKPGSDRDLTATEQRIIALAGAGQTSREVASALFMSVRTVDSHLGHIYRKLGLRSRTELALWASTQRTAGHTTADP
jgi:DNA-binding CsgD family transcriptional regulator/tetratricopeptide (TPR) repeat protein